MSKTLGDRLLQAKVVLKQVHALLAKHPALLPTDLGNSFRALSDYDAEIDHWIGMLDARAVARQFLDGLETRADANQNVTLGALSAKYHHVRLIGVQAYETTNWSIADSITAMVGRVLCTRAAAFQPQLASHFVQKDRKTKTAAVVFDSVKEVFGWPVGISYAIRNHFVHRGGQVGSIDFFEGPLPASAFQISADGWDYIDRTARLEYEVDQSHHRAGASWPSNPTDDLRVLLAICEREMDDALGVLLGAACGSLLAHVGFMVGED